MAEDNVSLGYRVKHWFTHHPWLKLIALALAVMLWLYIKGSLGSAEF
jgi:hypothetical protein